MQQIKEQVGNSKVICALSGGVDSSVVAKLISNFVFLICKIKKNWSLRDQKIKLINEVRDQVGSHKVICALSGGVDSSVVAQLLNKAIGKKLYCIFVNTGLLRKNEETQVIQTFKKRLKMNLIYVNAEKEFLGKLINISDPEKKKKDNWKFIY